MVDKVRNARYTGNADLFKSFLLTAPLGVFSALPRSALRPFGHAARPRLVACRSVLGVFQAANAESSGAAVAEPAFGRSEAKKDPARENEATAA
jgi:hypothetical protein